MRTLSRLILALALCGSALAATPLYNQAGRAVAFLDDNQVIYLWNGEAVAYLDPPYSATPSVVAFSGGHMGWLDKGALRDHEGRVWGSTFPQQQLPTPLEVPKAIRQELPQKLHAQPTPRRPADQPSWAPVPLEEQLNKSKGC
jgi:hypothetical protein